MKAFALLIGGGIALLLGIAIVVAGPDAGSEPSALALKEIPPYLLPVYVGAATTCEGLPWQVLAAIGFHESRHGDGRVDPSTGDVAPPILGPPIDGTNGNARIPDASFSDGWAHAMGPMQFIPSTWKRWGRLAPNRPAGRDAVSAERVGLDLLRRRVSVRRTSVSRKSREGDPVVRPQRGLRPLGSREGRRLRVRRRAALGSSRWLAE